jgi:excinuclease UvrABC nuclease subunit
MFDKLSKTMTEVVRFSNKHTIDADFRIYSVDDLKGNNGIPDNLWAEFEKDAGVYVFLSSDGKAVHYVGMSESDLGTRLSNWLFEDNKVNNVILGSDIILIIVLKNQKYMSPALESYLIPKLLPKLNVQKNA